MKALDLPLCTQMSPLQLSNSIWRKDQGETRHRYQTLLTECEAKLFRVSIKECYLFLYLTRSCDIG